MRCGLGSAPASPNRSSVSVMRSLIPVLGVVSHSPESRPAVPSVSAGSTPLCPALNCDRPAVMNAPSGLPNIHLTYTPRWRARQVKNGSLLL